MVDAGHIRTPIYATGSEMNGRPLSKKPGAAEETPCAGGPVTCKDGSVRQIEFRLASTGYLNYIVFTDVTRRKQDEDVLLERENRLQSVLRSAPIGIGVVTERIFQHVNQRLCEMTGYPEEELIGRSARVVYPDQEEYEYVGREKYEQIRKSGSGTVETRWKRKDGIILDVLLSSTPVDLEDLSKGLPSQHWISPIVNRLSRHCARVNRGSRIFWEWYRT